MDSLDHLTHYIQQADWTIWCWISGCLTRFGQQHQFLLLPLDSEYSFLYARLEGVGDKVGFSRHCQLHDTMVSSKPKAFLSSILPDIYHSWYHALVNMNHRLSSGVLMGRKQRGNYFFQEARAAFSLPSCRLRPTGFFSATQLFQAVSSLILTLRIAAFRRPRSFLCGFSRSLLPGFP